MKLPLLPLLSLLLLTCQPQTNLYGQSILYPNVSGQVVQVLSATGTTPTILTTTSNTFVSGDLVIVYAIWENTGSVNQYSNINSPVGVQRKICATSLSSTTVTICDLANTPVNTSNSILPYSGYIRLASIGGLNSGPRVGLGGWGGAVQMQIAATIRDATLTNITTLSSVATINYAFSHGLPSNCISPGGCKVQVRNATCSNENGIKTITVVNSTSVTYATTCTNATDANSNLSVSARAIDGQGPWEQVKALANNFGTPGSQDGICQDDDTGCWANWAADAMYWFVDPTQTTFLGSAVYEYQHYEDFLPAPEYCGQVGPYCQFASGHNRNPSYYITGMIPNFSIGLTLLKATGQLSGGEISAINNYLLNDAPTCVHSGETIGTGTITVSGTTVTTSVPTSLSVGDYIMYLSGGGTTDARWARIISGGPTVYTITSNFGNVINATYYLGSHFTSVSNSCGLANYLLASPPASTGIHDPRTVIQPVPTGVIVAPYSPIAGQWIGSQGDNRHVASSLAYISIDDSAADDTRGLLALQGDGMWSYDYHLSEYTGGWGGGAKAAFRYGTITSYSALYANLITATSVSSWPNYVALGHGLGGSQRIYTLLYSFLPNTSTSDPRFSPWLDATGWDFDSPNDGATLAAYSAVARGDIASQYFNYFLNNEMGTLWNTPNNLFRWVASFMFILYDPNTPTVNYATLPTQVQLADVDLAGCSSLGLTCNTGGSSSFFMNAIGREQAIWSRSGWVGNVTTFGQNYNGWASTQSGGPDHGAVIPGNYHIIRNISGDAGNGAYIGCLIGDDDGAGLTSTPCTFSEIAGYGINSWRYTTSLEAGSQLIPNVPTSLGPRLLRWSSNNTGSKFGDATSKVMCSSTDLSLYNQVSDGIIYSNRHTCHFKETGTDEFIILYDEVSRGSTYAIQAYTQYPQGGPDGCCASGTTSFSGGLLTSTNSEHQRIMTKWLNPAGVNSLAVINDGPTPNPGDGLASAYRLRHCPSTDGSTCASATGMEALQIHYITTDANSTFTAILKSPDVNWACAQVDGANDSKVGCFSRGGAVHNVVSNFTTTFSNSTAWYEFDGLTPGVYNIIVAGSAVSGSPFTVLAGDNSLGFRAGSGLVSFNGTLLQSTVPRSEQVVIGGGSH